MVQLSGLEQELTVAFRTQPSGFYRMSDMERLIAMTRSKLLHEVYCYPR